MINIYITNLGAYNRGFLEGDWVELPLDEDELKAKCQEILDRGLRQGCRDEELFITDQECDMKGIDIGEYSNITKLNELAQQIEDLSEYEQRDLKAILEVDGDFQRSMDILKEGNYSILFNCDDDDDIGRAMVEEGYFGIEIPECLQRYIDYEQIGRESDYTLVDDKIAIYTY